MENTKTKFGRFLIIDWDDFLIFFLKFKLRLSFPKTATPCRHFRVQSCESGRIFLDREPIRAREKHYSLVWCMLICHYLPRFQRIIVKYSTGSIHGNSIGCYTDPTYYEVFINKFKNVSEYF